MSLSASFSISNSSVRVVRPSYLLKLANRMRRSVRYLDEVPQEARLDPECIGKSAAMLEKHIPEDREVIEHTGQDSHVMRFEALRQKEGLSSSFYLVGHGLYSHPVFVKRTKDASDGPGNDV